MDISSKIISIQSYLEKLDIFSEGFSTQIDRIVNRHKIEGGNLEYVYVQHFYNEMFGLSKLFQYLLKDEQNKRYVFFAVRASLEILLQTEYILRLKKEDEHKILSLLSKDMAQSAISINEACLSENPSLTKNLDILNMFNKLLKTDFDLNRIKSNTKTFPNMRSLCDKSNLSIKDLSGGSIYKLYSLYSESNHTRLSNHRSTHGNEDILWSLEFFIEIYIRFYEQVLASETFSKEFNLTLESIKKALGVK